MKHAKMSDLQMSDAVRLLNPNLLAAPAPREYAPPMPNSVAKCAEKELQQAVEGWLHHRGYERLTPPAIGATLAGVVNPRGFFGHWFESQRNAFMPDLLLIPWKNNRPALMLELKVRNKYQSGQKQAITLGLWKVAFNLEQAQDIVMAWEEQ